MIVEVSDIKDILSTRLLLAPGIKIKGHNRNESANLEQSSRMRSVKQTGPKGNEAKGE